MQKRLKSLRVDMHAAQPTNWRSTRAELFELFNRRQRWKDCV